MLFHNDLTRSIRQSRPEPGRCAFWWLGQMGFVVKTASLTLCFDPFLSPDPLRLYPAPLSAEELAGVDILFGTHDHLDHIDTPVWKAVAEASPNTRLVLPAGLSHAIAQRLALPIQRLTGLREGDTLTLAGATVQAVTAAHEQLNDRDENEIFVVRADGVTICHMGDTCLYDGLIARLKALGPIDLLILPINGRDGRRLFQNCLGNMTWQEAADLVGAVRPRLAIPGHYEMMDGNTENPSLFAHYLEIKYPGQDFWIGPHARRVEFPLYD